MLLVILLAALGGYFAYIGYFQNRFNKDMKIMGQKDKLYGQTVTPTPSTESTSSADMTNWKTYTNVNNKFSFKYPSNWVINSAGVTEGSYINFFLEGVVAKKTENMHEAGNEVLKLLVYGDETIFNGLKNVVPAPENITVGGKVALKASNQVDILIGTTSKKILTIEVREPANLYINQRLSTLRFSN